MRIGEKIMKVFYAIANILLLTVIVMYFVIFAIGRDKDDFIIAVLFIILGRIHINDIDKEM